MCVYIYIYIYVQHIPTYIHTYIHTYINTYIYMYMYIHTSSLASCTRSCLDTGLFYHRSRSIFRGYRSLLPYTYQLISLLHETLLGPPELAQLSVMVPEPRLVRGRHSGGRHLLQCALHQPIFARLHVCVCI